MTVVHIDATVGVAGDMLLAALVDAGANRELIHRSITAMLPQADVKFTEVHRCGLRALATTITAPAESPYRHWRDLRTALSAAPMSEPIRAGALATFTALAAAEGQVHGIAPDAVHFHEVGAWDSICDVVGTVAALVSLDPAVVTAGPLGTGAGTVTTDHGILPVPSPAVAQLLANVGAAAEPGPARFEACTPTGAALVATLTDAWQAGPALRTRRVGVGAGTADPATHPNVTRVFVGEALADSAALPQPTAVVLSTNIDDMDPRLWPSVLAELLDAGASDAWVTPITMKKGRPAMSLSVLCPAPVHEELARVIMTLTPAIGMRVQPTGKLAADRRIASIDVLGQPVRVKVASWQGAVVNVQPEWDDVLAAARAVDRPAKELLALAHEGAGFLWRDNGY